ncbi:uncharacterized protein BX663DRAFT_509103 [Cokeromyces recurvatus]|uniref:uncharacterized protein n=1 Tax=Cokeromyces recurvatus TaxID=90255 RepID=UPI0022210A7B|nr:uncharacterized protein BX663DRAFT_509103 [Cokeromyces recurvatus]KAI7902985.1 hypothetical protein BX663DRAFT_509103 [Cokeromyces recurvatus]
MPVIVPFFSGAKQLTIELAEPVVILRGTHDDKITHVLQGEVSLVLTRPISISQVVIQFVGKSHGLWPEGIGARGTKYYHEKIIHEQNMILQSYPDTPRQEGILSAGIHRWPFQFLLSNQLIETIEDEMAKVFYYVTAVVHRIGMGATKLQSRRDILLLRTPNWSDNALTANSLPTTSITSERRLEICDATICIEKSNVSSGTQFPIIISLSPNLKNIYLESISVVLTEKRVYRLPEFQAFRSETHDFKVNIASITNLTDSTFHHQRFDLSMKDMRRLLNVKNAHIPLNDHGPFYYRLIFTLPNCVYLNHTSTFSEIDIRHTLKIRIELSSSSNQTRTHIRLETPITILDCRLKEDYNALPTYEEALLLDPIVDHDSTVDSKSPGFFICPCYLEYKKKRKCTRRDWMLIRNEQHLLSSGINATTQHSFHSVHPPPSYESIDMKQ